MRRFSGNKIEKGEARSLIHRLQSYRLIRNMLIGFIIVSIANVLFSSLFYTPKLYRLVDKNRELKLRYEVLQNRIRTSQRKLEQIRHRDNYVYRPLFSTDTLAVEGIYSPYDDEKYEHIIGDDYSPAMLTAWRELDQFARSLYLESVSLDELQALSKDKEKFPKYHVWKFHSGVDMPGRVGDPVYATGDGVVRETVLSRARTGYGTQILLDHGFGYKTRYAHLSKILVQKGDSVKRGQLIGEVGNTGVSTSPHLHYEVIYMRSHVNPINYFDKNMSADAYKSLMGQIQDENYEAD